MAYPIYDRWLDPKIQEQVAVIPSALVIHSTANPGATDEGHYKWLNGARRHGWANYYLDWDSISRLVPEGMMAPAQGPTMNQRAISIELCEPSLQVSRAEQEKMFNGVWDRGVWCAADILWRHGWHVDRMYSHADISRLYPRETDHTDPIGFFARYGREWRHFQADVGAKLKEWSTKYGQAEEWQYAAVKALTEVQVEIDGRTEPFLQTPRHPFQPMEWWEAAILFKRLLDSRRA